jgi:hypothetical protein
MLKLNAFLHGGCFDPFCGSVGAAGVSATSALFVLVEAFAGSI